MAFSSEMKAILQVPGVLTPFIVIGFALFLRLGIYEYLLAAIVAFIDLIEHFVLVSGEM